MRGHSARGMSGDCGCEKSKKWKAEATRGVRVVAVGERLMAVHGGSNANRLNWARGCDCEIYSCD